MKGRESGIPTINSLKRRDKVCSTFGIRNTGVGVLSVFRVSFYLVLSYKRQPGFPHHVHVV